MHGKDDSAAVIVHELFVSIGCKSTLDKKFGIVLLCRRRGDEHLAEGYTRCVLGRIAKLKFANDLFPEAAFLEIAEADVLPFFRFEKRTHKEFGGEIVEDVKAFGRLLLFALLIGNEGLLNLDAVAIGQP